MYSIERRGKGGLKAGDVMTRDVITVSPSTTVKALCKILDEHGITGAPVVDEDGRIVGIVSQTDILVSQPASQVRREDYDEIYDLFSPSPDPDAPLAGHRRSARWVEDIMTRKVQVAEEDMGILELCAMMSKMRIHRVPVARDGRLVGIVSALDLVALLAASQDGQRGG